MYSLLSVLKLWIEEKALYVPYCRWKSSRMAQLLIVNHTNYLLLLKLSWFFTDSSENSCDDDSAGENLDIFAENGNFKIYSERLLLETEYEDRKYEGEEGQSTCLVTLWYTMFVKNLACLWILQLGTVFFVPTNWTKSFDR